MSTREALNDFIQRYLRHYRQSGSEPFSRYLCDQPSPCVMRQSEQGVYWQPQPYTADVALQPVETALDIRLRPEITTFYFSYYCADMAAFYKQNIIRLLQNWNDEDVIRLQQNLIGHLLMQKQRRLSPTLFLATTQDDQWIISLCNLTGVVYQEQPGTAQRLTLAESLAAFLDQLHPATEAEIGEN